MKVLVFANCYSATYTTPDQQRFTISEVAADWHELMLPQPRQRTTGPVEQIGLQTYHCPN